MTDERNEAERWPMDERKGFPSQRRGGSWASHSYFGEVLGALEGRIYMEEVDEGWSGVMSSRLDFPLSPLLCFKPTVKGTAFSTTCFHHDMFFSKRIFLSRRMLLVFY